MIKSIEFLLVTLNPENETIKTVQQSGVDEV